MCCSCRAMMSWAWALAETGRVLLLEDLDAGTDRRQRIAQLVRQRGEELVLPPVGFAQPFLAALQLLVGRGQLAGALDDPRFEILEQVLPLLMQVLHAGCAPPQRHGHDQRKRDRHDGRRQAVVDHAVEPHLDASQHHRQGKRSDQQPRGEYGIGVRVAQTRDRLRRAGQHTCTAGCQQQDRERGHAGVPGFVDQAADVERHGDQRQPAHRQRRASGQPHQAGAQAAWPCQRAEPGAEQQEARRGDGRHAARITIRRLREIEAEPGLHAEAHVGQVFEQGQDRQEKSNGRKHPDREARAATVGPAHAGEREAEADAQEAECRGRHHQPPARHDAGGLRGAECPADQNQQTRKRGCQAGGKREGTRHLRDCRARRCGVLSHMPLRRLVVSGPSLVQSASSVIDSPSTVPSATTAAPTASGFSSTQRDTC